MAAPLNIPTISKPTPIVLDELLIETTDSNKALYDRMLEKGHYHPDQQKYPAYRFLKQAPTSYGQMQYWWANGFTSQDSYNAVKTYEANANAYPTFIRSYRVLRAEYLVNGPSTKGLAFTGVASVAVTNGGANYTDDFAVTFSGGSGSNAAGLAIVDKATGTVLRVELNNAGIGYTGAPSVGFAGGTGTGAAATAVIQPTTCVLVEEVHSKLPEDDPYQSLYDKVEMKWITLPGPVLTSNAIDPETGDVVVKTSQLVAAGTSGTATNSSGQFAEVTAIDSVTSTKTTDFTVGADLASGRTWHENRFISLPRVLTRFTPQVFDDTDNNIIRASFWSVLLNLSNYYDVTVFERWLQTAPGITGPTPLMPEELSWDTPFGPGQIAECIHDAVSIDGSIPGGVIVAGFKAGGYRYYHSASWNYDFSATTPSASGLSGSIIYIDERVTPHNNGGFLYHSETIQIPSYSVA